MMRSQVSNPAVIGTTIDSPQAPTRTRRRAQSVAVQGNTLPQETRRASLFESNVSYIHDESSSAPKLRDCVAHVQSAQLFRESNCDDPSEIHGWATPMNFSILNKR